MSAAAMPPMLLFERTGRWAASLRRHGFVERVRLIEARSLAELDELLAPLTAPLVGLELSQSTAERAVAWLWRNAGGAKLKAAVIFADRSLRPLELLCREAGAAHFVASELELFTLPPLLERYRSIAPVDPPADVDLSRVQTIRARLPWSDRASGAA